MPVKRTDYSNAFSPLSTDRHCDVNHPMQACFREDQSLCQTWMAQGGSIVKDLQFRASRLILASLQP
ncbi:hypothetical protein NITMOv2_3686 [Nitrospira moscoviensis]|uniref:Uncharacterized protein n=1 Tax=Nitrospira moscoviensis TaxID=42253 RepID=A0A0K2GGI7_NITMO|nr:hypothetical protein NITMOv2_3686 [Nitrospira moscoviensis]